MIRLDNIISFITVCGFFIGLMFCVVNVQEPTDILLYTLEITLFFYLLAHVVVMNFVSVRSLSEHAFNTNKHEETSTHFIDAIEDRESKIQILLKLQDMQNKNEKSSKNERYKKKTA